MGIPITSTVYEELLNLSKEDKIKVIAWIAETMLGEATEQEADEKNDQLSSIGEIRPPKPLTSSERTKQLAVLNGSWSGSESAEQLVEDVYSSRTTEDRKHLFNE